MVSKPRNVSFLSQMITFLRIVGNPAAIIATFWVIVNQQELSSRNLQALVEALDWGLKQQELSRNLKILHGGKIWQELSENSRNLEGLG